MALVSTSRAVESLTMTPPGGATDSIRCAIPTCSPMAVYDIGPAPISPVITSPEFSPILSCRPMSSRRSTSAAKCCASVWMSSAARQARTAWSSSAIGAPNTAMMPSPVNLSTVPP